MALDNETWKHLQLTSRGHYYNWYNATGAMDDFLHSITDDDLIHSLIEGLSISHADVEINLSIEMGQLVPTLGTALMSENLGDYEGALKLYKELELVRPYDPDVKVAIARILFKREQYDDAKPYLLEAAKYDSAKALDEAYKLTAMILAIEGNETSALVMAYMPIMIVDPTSSDNWLFHALMASRFGWLEEAEKSKNQAVKLGVSGGYSYLYLAEIELRLGNDEVARQYAQRAIESDINLEGIIKSDELLSPLLR